MKILKMKNKHLENSIGCFQQWTLVTLVKLPGLLGCAEMKKQNNAQHCEYYGVPGGADTTFSFQIINICIDSSMAFASTY